MEEAPASHARMSTNPFFAEALPYAKQAHAATGVLMSVILGQWADETGYGGYDWSVLHNPGNVSPNDAEGSYPTLQAGVDAYISTMKQSDYAAVRSAKDWRAQCVALGQSPWAGGHYDATGGGPGSDLIDIVTEFDLTQYDEPAVKHVPTPSPPLKHVVGMAATPGGGGYWLVTGEGSVSHFGDAAALGSLPNAPATPVVGIAATASGQGYWLVAANGAVFPFGDAKSEGGSGKPGAKQPDAKPGAKQPDDKPGAKQPDDKPGDKQPDDKPGAKQPDDKPGDKKPAETGGAPPHHDAPPPPEKR
jgi:hypothetical protein